MKRATAQVCRTLADVRDAIKKRHGNEVHTCLEFGGTCDYCAAETEWLAALDQCLLLLSPPKKKRPRDVPRGAKARRQPSVPQLDALCREVVFLRDKGACRVCGRTDGLMDWAHVYSRRFRIVRWDLDNSMVLCRKHHMWWHDSPIEAIEWWREHVGNKALLLDLKKRAGRAKPGARLLVKAHLEQEKRRLA